MIIFTSKPRDRWQRSRIDGNVRIWRDGKRIALICPMPGGIKIVSKYLSASEVSLLAVGADGKTAELELVFEKNSNT
jgi:hypothetical protein